MREHANLAAMVGFVGKHVAQHLRPDQPRPSPSISAEFLDSARTTKRFGEHLSAPSGALRQSCTSLLRRAARSIELPWNF